MFSNYKVPFNPFTPGTLMGDNPLIPWDFLVENKCMRAPKINHMCFKTRVKLWRSNKLFLLDELMGSQGILKIMPIEEEKAVEEAKTMDFNKISSPCNNCTDR